MELHRALFVPCKTGNDALSDILSNSYNYLIQNFCIETAIYGFDLEHMCFNSINLYRYPMILTSDFKYGKYLKDFNVKSVPELLIKLEIEGFLTN